MTERLVPHYSLAEAAKRLGGGITARSLRTEIHKGNLSFAKVAGKYLVTDNDLMGMLERCRAKAKGRACGSSKDTGKSESRQS